MLGFRQKLELRTRREEPPFLKIFTISWLSNLINWNHFSCICACKYLIHFFYFVVRFKARWFPQESPWREWSAILRWMRSFEHAYHIDVLLCCEKCDYHSTKDNFGDILQDGFILLKKWILCPNKHRIVKRCCELCMDMGDVTSYEAFYRDRNAIKCGACEYPVKVYKTHQVEEGKWMLWRHNFNFCLVNQSLSTPLQISDPSVVVRICSSCHHLRNCFHPRARGRELHFRSRIVWGMILIGSLVF